METSLIQRPIWGASLVLFALLLLTVAISLGLGAVRISPLRILASLFHQVAPTNAEHIILFQIRLPRILSAVIVGAALSVAGLLYQGLFRNPMADPYTIGSSGGAALGATLSISLLPALSFLGFSATAMLSLLGSLLSTAVVYLIARHHGRVPVVSLLLTGFAVSAILSNGTSFILSLNPQTALALRFVGMWMQGAISVPPWLQLGVIGGMAVLGIVCAFPLAHALNTLAFGEEAAQQLGMRVERTRLFIILTASLLTAAAVSLGGIISFVGLIVPHFLRLLFGPDHVRLLILTAIAGATFMVVTDTLARTVLAPTEVPVGVLTAFLGGPLFLYLLRRGRKELTV